MAVSTLEKTFRRFRALFDVSTTSPFFVCKKTQPPFFHILSDSLYEFLEISGFAVKGASWQRNRIKKYWDRDFRAGARDGRTGVRSASAESGVESQLSHHGFRLVMIVTREFDVCHLKPTNDPSGFATSPAGNVRRRPRAQYTISCCALGGPGHSHGAPEAGSDEVVVEVSMKDDKTSSENVQSRRAVRRC